MLYATDKCNARCKHCYIWAKSPKQCMDMKIVEKIVSDKAVSQKTRIGLEGGEFLLHYRHENILELLTEKHPSFDLLSNCVLPDNLTNLVKKYLVPLQNKAHPPRLYISLDGTQTTHDRLRGVSGLYNSVLEVIRTLGNTLPISVMFTLMPFNTFEDLEHVAKICENFGLDLRIGIYNNMQYFETKVSSSAPNSSLDYPTAAIPDFVRNFEENFDFLALYHYYRQGELSLPCRSIRDSVVVYPNGDIPLCQNKEIILGNLHEKNLSQIINNKETLKLHKQYKRCNDCWINFHRKYDIVLYRNLEKIFGKKLVELALGNYQWCGNKKLSYKDTIQQITH